jgi:hypothetical protein
LRRLIRDYSMIDELSMPLNVEHYKKSKFPYDFISDIMFKLLNTNRNNANVRLRKVYFRKSLQPSRYHQVVDQVPADAAETAVASNSMEEGE